MWRENMGRVLIILAGGGCLALTIFVAAPMVNRQGPPTTPEEVVGEVAGPDEAARPEAHEGGFEDVMEAPSPLVAVGNGGNELPVVFRAAEPRGSEGDEAGTGESGLPPVLSPEEVAEAMASVEDAVPPEPGPADEWVRVASAPDVEPLESEEGEKIEAAAAGQSGGADTQGEAGTKDAEAADVEGEGTTEAAEVAATPAGVEEPATAGGGVPDETEPVAEGTDDEAAETEPGHEPGDEQIVDVALPALDVETRAAWEASEPSGKLPDSSPPGAGQAGRPKSGLPPHAAEIDRAGVVVPGTLRGVMGYRLPLVSRQEVPDQIVSGVLIPAHTTFVILRDGWWELVGMSEEEVERLRELGERQAEAAAQREPEAEKPGWTLLRMFKRRKAPAGE